MNAIELAKLKQLKPELSGEPIPNISVQFNPATNRYEWIYTPPLSIQWNMNLDTYYTTVTYGIHTNE